MPPRNQGPEQIARDSIDKMLEGATGAATLLQRYGSFEAASPPADFLQWLKACGFIVRLPR
jgi:hypothetical protein